MNELEEYFRKLRFDENFHLGLGDVRLTIAMQEEVVAIAKRVASQQSVQSDVCPSCGVDDWAYGDDEHTFEVCAMCGKRR